MIQKLFDSRKHQSHCKDCFFILAVILCVSVFQVVQNNQVTYNPLSGLGLAKLNGTIVGSKYQFKPNWVLETIPLNDPQYECRVRLYYKTEKSFYLVKTTGKHRGDVLGPGDLVYYVSPSQPLTLFDVVEPKEMSEELDESICVLSLNSHDLSEIQKLIGDNIKFFKGERGLTVGSTLNTLFMAQVESEGFSFDWVEKAISNNFEFWDEFSSKHEQLSLEAFTKESLDEVLGAELNKRQKYILNYARDELIPEIKLAIINKYKMNKNPRKIKGKAKRGPRSTHKRISQKNRKRDTKNSISKKSPTAQNSQNSSERTPKTEVVREISESSKSSRDLVDNDEDALSESDSHKTQTSSAQNSKSEESDPNVPKKSIAKESESELAGSQKNLEELVSESILELQKENSQTLSQVTEILFQARSHASEDRESISHKDQGESKLDTTIDEVFQEMEESSEFKHLLADLQESRAENASPLKSTSEEISVFQSELRAAESEEVYSDEQTETSGISSKILSQIESRDDSSQSSDLFGKSMEEALDRNELGPRGKELMAAIEQIPNIIDEQLQIFKAKLTEPENVELMQKMLDLVGQKAFDKLSKVLKSEKLNFLSYIVVKELGTHQSQLNATESFSFFVQSWLSYEFSPMLKERFIESFISEQGPKIDFGELVLTELDSRIEKIDLQTQKNQQESDAFTIKSLLSTLKKVLNSYVNKSVMRVVMSERVAASVSEVLSDFRAFFENSELNRSHKFLTGEDIDVHALVKFLTYNRHVVSSELQEIVELSVFKLQSNRLILL